MFLQPGHTQHQQPVHKPPEHFCAGCSRRMNSGAKEHFLQSSPLSCNDAIVQAILLGGLVIVVLHLLDKK
jgi:hypothetical protein